MLEFPLKGMKFKTFSPIPISKILKFLEGVLLGLLSYSYYFT